MKRIYLTGIMIFCLSLFAKSQVNSNETVHHNGFQASLYTGAVFGDVNATIGDLGKTTITGDGMHMLFHVGYAYNDWSVGFAFGTNSLNMKTFVVNDTSWALIPGYSIDNSITGIYVKRYFMPINIFIGAEVGFGRFSMYDDSSIEPRGQTDKGFAWNMEVGKEFQLGKRKRFGLGLYANICGIKCNDVPPWSSDVYKYLAPGVGVAISWH